MKTILAHRGVTYEYNDNTIESLCDIFNYASTKFKLGHFFYYIRKKNYIRRFL